MNPQHNPYRSPAFRLLTILASGLGGMMLGVWALSVTFPHAMTSASNQTIGAIISALCALAASAGAHAYFIGLDESRDYLRREVEVDKITGFHSRIAVVSAIARAALLAKREARELVLVDIEIDRFKNVNESIGYQRGDHLIRALGQRLSDYCGTQMEIGRIGAGEMLLIIDPRKLDRPLEKFLDGLAPCIQEPFDLDGVKLAITISVGVLKGVDPATEPNVHMRRVNLALQRSRASGHGVWTYYQQEMGRYAEYRNWLEAEMHQSLERGEFELHYQPQVEMATGRIVGHEALLRWRHPIRGLIAPIDFIPVAEETGFIVRLGEWVIRRACEDIRRLPEDQYVAVNLSAIQFSMGDVLEVVDNAIADSGISPSRLELEITESAMVNDKKRTGDILRALSERGISVAIDDFGTGYSNLGYLADFPISKLKIDRSFVRRIGTDAQSGAIVSSIVGLSRALGISTIAEGVETNDQAILLKAAGCKIVQGYLYGKPAPLQETPSDNVTPLRPALRA